MKNCHPVDILCKGSFLLNALMDKTLKTAVFKPTFNSYLLNGKPVTQQLITKR